MAVVMTECIRSVFIGSEFVHIDMVRLESYFNIALRAVAYASAVSAARSATASYLYCQLEPQHEGSWILSSLVEIGGLVISYK